MPRISAGPVHGLLVTTLTLAVALLAAVVPSAAEAAATPSLSLSGPAIAQRGSSPVLTATLTTTAGAPFAGQPVRLEVGDGSGGWSPAGTVDTDGAGRAAFGPSLGATTTYRVVRDQVGAGSGDDAAAVSSPLTVKAYDAVTALSLSGPASGYVDSQRSLSATLTRGGTTAVAGEPVRLQRRVGGTWSTVQKDTTDAGGVVRFAVTVRPADNAFRAVYDGRYDRAGTPDNLKASLSGVLTLTPLKRATVLRLRGPSKVVDETSATLLVTWLAGNGASVRGPVTIWRRLAGGNWTRYTTVTPGPDGNVSLSVRPRVNSRWRAVGAEGRWWKADSSDVLAIDNVPPGAPVVYPAGAPRPRVATPPQARATGAGPNAVVSQVPDAVWRSMVGRSWHAGCPVGRGALRLVRVNYWGYDGYRHRGEIVLRDAVAQRGAALFSAIYRARLPIYRLYRVDRFGWSSRLHGANDYRSMAAGNTSGFNCRSVVNSPGTRSPHSYGRSIDINTWENPYRSATGLVPNAWWQSRSHARIAWRSSSHPMVRTMAAHGFRWTYGLGDTQHFDG